MLYLFTFFSLILCFVRKVYSVPPDACFAKFRWEDCGKPPTPVIYYWKSGSRCEVGLWRGCLPNTNMFKDEYECVATCIFTARARPEDYHNYNEIEPLTEIADIETTTLIGNDTEDSNNTSTDSGPDSEASTAGNETVVTDATAGGDSTGGSETNADGAATDANGAATGVDTQAPNADTPAPAA